ncbi:MAG: hypothetical protein P8Y72_17375, partial [Anaerolineales bacterium]
AKLGLAEPGPVFIAEEVVEESAMSGNARRFGTLRRVPIVDDVWKCRDQYGWCRSAPLWFLCGQGIRSRKSPPGLFVYV